MATTNTRSYTPLITLALVAALVAVIGLWAADRATRGSTAETVSTAGGVQDAAQFEWKIVTT